MSDYDGGSRNRRDHSVWDFLNRLLLVLVVFTVIGITVAAFLPKLKMQREQTARLEQLKADIEKQRALLARRTSEIDLLQHDPGYVEIIARDRLDLMKDGETIFRVEPQTRPDTSNFKRHER